MASTNSISVHRSHFIHLTPARRIAAAEYYSLQAFPGAYIKTDAILDRKCDHLPCIPDGKSLHNVLAEVFKSVSRLQRRFHAVNRGKCSLFSFEYVKSAGAISGAPNKASEPSLML